MQQQNILITGANGMLGQKLVDLFVSKPEYNVLYTSFGASRLNPSYKINFQILDVSNEEAVKKMVSEFNPDVIIHCAAMTHVDGCEDDKDKCWALNVHAVQYFVDAIADSKTKFIHISTDFVFDGISSLPYLENHAVNPLSAYGMSKKESEDVLINSKINYTILRTSFVYGVLWDNSRSNFVLWSKSSLEQGKEINVIADQYRAPTFAEDLAMACFQAMEKDVKGMYHVVGPETFSILDLIKQVAEFWNLDQRLISPTLTKNLNQKAKRPLHTNLSIEKARSDFGYAPISYRESLNIIKKQLNTKS